MNELTKEWISRAEDDYQMAYRALEPEDAPIPGAACFHAQQCAEKYLKAYLQEHQVRFPQTHNLISLLEISLTREPRLNLLRQSLTELESYAVAVRYPGASATVAQARIALDAMESVRRTISDHFG
jgi:HEPN domain-containing protein